MGFSYLDQLQAIVAELKDVKEAQKKSDEAQKKSDERQALMGEQIRNLRAQTWGEDFITVRASTLDDWSLDWQPGFDDTRSAIVHGGRLLPDIETIRVFYPPGNPNAWSVGKRHSRTQMACYTRDWNHIQRTSPTYSSRCLKCEPVLTGYIDGAVRRTRTISPKSSRSAMTLFVLIAPKSNLIPLRTSRNSRNSKTIGSQAWADRSSSTATLAVRTGGSSLLCVCAICFSVNLGGIVKTDQCVLNYIGFETRC